MRLYIFSANVCSSVCQAFFQVLSTPKKYQALNFSYAGLVINCQLLAICQQTGASGLFFCSWLWWYLALWTSGDCLLGDVWLCHFSLSETVTVRINVGVVEKKKFIQLIVGSVPVAELWLVRNMGILDKLLLHSDEYSSVELDSLMEQRDGFRRFEQLLQPNECPGCINIKFLSINIKQFCQMLSFVVVIFLQLEFSL